jgi:hypothetical protein
VTRFATAQNSTEIRSSVLIISQEPAASSLARGHTASVSAVATGTGIDKLPFNVAAARGRSSLS